MCGTPDPGFLSAPYIVEHILSFLGMIVTFGAGYWTARRVHELDVKRRQKGVALALKEEVGRIRAGVGPLREDAELSYAFSSGIVIPEVHPWVQGIIAEAAETNPAIVGSFMRLDTVLYNLQHQGEPHQRAVKAFQEASARVAELEAEAKKNPSRMPEKIAEFLSGELMAKNDMKVAQRNLDQEERYLGIIHKVVHEELDKLTSLLTAAAEKPRRKLPWGKGTTA